MRITFFLLYLWVGCILVMLQPVFAQNPFTAKPKSKAHQMTTNPAAKNSFLSIITQWQHRLNRKMADLVREAKATHSVKPLAFLLLVAFAYGMLHAAGPGHGKALAVSYILSQRPKLFRGMFFGSFIALFHGLSGILFVLIIHIILQKSITGTLEDVTRITQMISFSLIVCLGLGILIKSSYKWIKSVKGDHPPYNGNHKRHFHGPFLSALVVGMIPCSGVVMVMLFALSMKLVGLGIMLGITISMGMALTITCVVVMVMSGKAVSLGMVERHKSLALTLENLIETIAGLMIASLGVLFLAAVI
jgi:ABC-type nickel/cobalt efflux system permease component RcnA